MARRASDAPKGAETGTSTETNTSTETKAPPRTVVIEALMRLAAEQPWSDIELTDIAAEAGVSLATLRGLYPSKGAILGAFSRMIDEIVLEGTSDDLADEPARERLLDVLMRRLDAMAPYRKALRRIMAAVRGDPLTLAALNGVALNSQRYMLAAAGIRTEGPLGGLKVQGTVIAFARSLEVFLEDEDPGLSRTLAHLDGEIRRGERLMERAEDARRLTAPLRALGQAFADRARRRRSGARGADTGEDEDPATII